KDLENAKTKSTRALKRKKQKKKGDIHHFSAQALGGMILFHHQQYAKAKKMLVSALEYFKAILSDLHYCETAFALGLVYWEEKDNRTALTYFTLGLEKASQEGYRFFPLTNENLLIKILLIILVYHRKPATEDYCLSLISKCNPELVFEQIAPFLKQKDKNKYIENLRLVYKRLLPIARIETLGQFNIFLGNRLLDPKSFEGTRPVLLLKAIVLHGSRDIPKEVLIDDLWPKAAPKAGDKNFKTTLHRLRKAIEPRPQKEFGFSYILQKAGLISLDPELVVLDVDDFMAYGTKAMETEKNNKFQRALTYYGRAVDAYKGDYFAEEPYKEWIARKRDLLKARFLELLKRKARLHEELDQMDRAKGAWHLILEADPYYEAAYQNLMILYADSGQRHKAMDIFKEFCLLLKAEVGSEPNAETLRIFNNIRSR
ncbi:MAG: protein MalT, partial [Desulfobacteraceae bacterium]|nr:protein MalT [Desulfobacteraceae bacterium]